MQVMIDGVWYVPAQEVKIDNLLLSALAVRFDSDAGRDLTVRDYLYELLSTLWREGEGFSGKRPFGNSGWEYEIYAPLIKQGFIDGVLDEEGYVSTFNESQANVFVARLIHAAIYGVKDE